MEHTYGFVVQFSEEDGCYVASVPELRFCQAHGDTAEEAVAAAEEAVQLQLEEFQEEDHAAPSPRHRSGYSGRFQVRVPKSLHRQLVQLAELEGTSLNAFIATTLAAAVARSEPPARGRAGGRRRGLQMLPGGRSRCA